MHYRNFLPVLTLAASVRSFVIPENTGDGVYAVSLDERGVESHTRIGDATDYSNDSVDLVGRAEGQIWCGCGFNMNPSDTDAAVADLKNQLNNMVSNSGHIGAYLSYYSIRGGTVAFACNRSDRNKVISGGNLGDYLAAITSSCGLYIAGTYQVFADAYPLMAGYMRYTSGLDFCGAATGSPANHC